MVASTAWDARSGTVSRGLSKTHRALFFGLDYFQAATAFTLYTTVARFWAELAYAARQGMGSTRPIGGGDEYRWVIVNAVTAVAIARCRKQSSIVARASGLFGDTSCTWLRSCGNIDVEYSTGGCLFLVWLEARVPFISRGSFAWRHLTSCVRRFHLYTSIPLHCVCAPGVSADRSVLLKHSSVSERGAHGNTDGAASERGVC